MSPSDDPYALLREAMKQHGLSRADVARMTGRDTSTVWRWLARRGRTRPDEASRIILERRFGIPAHAWLSRAERAVIGRAGLLSVPPMASPELAATGTDGKGE